MARSPFQNVTPRLVLNVVRLVLMLGGIGFLVYTLPRIYHLVTMSLIALLVAYMLDPPVEWLEQHFISRAAATTLVFLLLFGLVIWGAVEVYPFLRAQYVELQELLSQRGPAQIIRNFVERVETNLPIVPRGSLSGRVEETYQWMLGRVTGVLKNLYTALQYFVIVPFIAFFLIRDKRRLRRFIVESVPNPFFEMTFNIFYKIEVKFGDYIRSLMLESLIIALLAAVGLWIIGLPYALVIGLFAGVANVVPYFGPLAGMVPAVLVQALQTPEPFQQIPVILVFVVVQLVDNVFVKPVIISRSMNMHPLLVLIFVVAGGQMYGVPGMILAVPLGSMFFVVVSQINWAYRNYHFKL